MTRLAKAGFRLLIVTNQSGVGRGYFTEETVQAIHQRLEDSLSKAGIMLDAIYYCPHAPDAACACRKPKPTLFLQAAKEHDLDLSASYGIGDKLEDALAAKNAGCRAILLRSPHAQANTVEADFFAASLPEAVSWILKQRLEGSSG